MHAVGRAAARPNPEEFQSQAGPSLPRIYCAKCSRKTVGKLVECRVERHDQMNLDAIVIDAFCHGEHDRCVIPHTVLEDMTSTQLPDGWAFVEPAKLPR